MSFWVGVGNECHDLQKNVGPPFQNPHLLNHRKPPSDAIWQSHRNSCSPKRLTHGVSVSVSPVVSCGDQLFFVLNLTPSKVSSPKIQLTPDQRATKAARWQDNAVQRGPVGSTTSLYQNWLDWDQEIGCEFTTYSISFQNMLGIQV